MYERIAVDEGLDVSAEREGPGGRYVLAWGERLAVGGKKEEDLLLVMD